MTRIRRISELAGHSVRPRCTPRSARRRRAEASPTGLVSRVLRFASVLVLGSLLLGVWNLRVGAVVLRGMCLTGSTAVEEVAARMLGSRWVLADTRGAARALEGQAWVEEATARRTLFGRVEVRIREHQALFRCADAPGLVVTCCGTVVDAPAGLDLDSLPVLDGAMEASRRSRDGLREVLDVLHSNAWPFERTLQEVHLQGPGGIEFVLEDGTEVWLGDTGLRSRLEWLSADPSGWRREDVRRVDLRFDRQVVLAGVIGQRNGE